MCIRDSPRATATPKSPRPAIIGPIFIPQSSSTAASPKIKINIFRDLRNNFECIEDTFSIVAGLFPPAWLAYEQKWWVLSFFSIFSLLLLSINPWIFAIGWIIVSIYCYKAQKNLIAIYDAFVKLDASMIEINPLAVTKEEEVLAIDCKASFDDNALYRQRQVAEMKDENGQLQIDVRDQRSQKMANLSLDAGLMLDVQLTQRMLLNIPSYQGKAGLD